jgi:exopolyphosphatase / guanosine-5'-triphosphate,3'-diphosphate pyrophosphatase
MAKALYLKSAPAPDPDTAQRVEWAGLLHEIGYTVSHIGFHKHGAYILENADMPGFSAQEQRQLALLVLGCRGGLSKMTELLRNIDLVAQILALRLAVLFHHARREIDTPRITLKAGRTIKFGVSKRWLKLHPLTTHLLGVEREEWAALRHPWRPKG